ncbi:MAG: choice-of-anchor B family protein [Bacteroidetes bacterium]|nr:choice-of-anchor B family protein [Bacteroidota bacterium]
MTLHYRALPFVALLALVTGSAFSQTPCSSGSAAGYPCMNTTLLSAMTPIELGAAPSEASLNDVWGWTDPDSGIEYALVGRRDGVSFVDISDPLNPRVVANLPTQTRATSWRDIKVYQNHAYVVADNALEHGMQVFDLTRLRGMSGDIQVVSPDTVYSGFASSHNVVINEDSGFAYAVGSSGGTSCAGGLHMIDISEPTNPVFVGCQTDATIGRGYTHDAQCVIYHGPDTEHVGKEICFNANEAGVNIADVSDKEHPATLSFVTYPTAQYVHQGWLTEDHKYYYQDDELDELRAGTNTKTMIWDVTDLDDPVLVKAFDQGTSNIDHNLYVRGDLLFEANYRAGMRIYDISDRENPVLVSYFDTYPSDDDPQFSGAWSVYPYFNSGNIVINGFGGFFIVRTPVLAALDHGIEPDAPGSVDVFPNPFVESATVRVRQNSTGPLRVDVHDILGRRVATLFDGAVRADETIELDLDGTNLPAGQYLIVATAPSGRVVRNMTKGN